MALSLAATSVVLALFGGCAKPIDHPDIRTVLDRQIEAWNQGDLEGFMAHYWRSDELVFESPKGKTHGWQATLERYQKAYPTREAMGRLKFDIGKIAPTGDDTAEIAGRFHLMFADDRTSSGRFYLHLRQIDGAWVIVRDFTVGD